MKCNKIDDKLKLAEGATSRANGGLYFIDEWLRLMENRYKGTDIIYSRSLYILFSHSFELILNSLFILASSKQKGSEIIKDIISIKPPHDLEKLSKKIPNNTLFKIGIRDIKKSQSKGFVEYIVNMIDKEKIVVQDLVDVRYDFKKGNLRQLDLNEADRIKKEVEILHELVKKIQVEYNLLGAGKNKKSL
jgi:mevalonate kinase